MTRFSPAAHAAAVAALLALVSTAHAVPLNNAFVAEMFLDTALPGTTVAARPELAGTVLVDLVQPFSYPALNISGSVQSRVVRETVAGTLDFYWRVRMDPDSTGGGVSAVRIGNFDYAHMTDADWRIDGIGSAAAEIARLFNPATHPEGFINFLFDPAVLPGDPGDGISHSFFLHTDAIYYKRTASYDLLAGPNETLSSVFETFAPSTPEPGSLLLLGTAAALAALAVRRRTR